MNIDSMCATMRQQGYPENVIECILPKLDSLSDKYDQIKLIVCNVITVVATVEGIVEALKIEAISPEAMGALVS